MQIFLILSNFFIYRNFHLILLWSKLKSGIFLSNQPNEIAFLHCMAMGERGASRGTIGVSVRKQSKLDRCWMIKVMCMLGIVLSWEREVNTGRGIGILDAYATQAVKISITSGQSLEIEDGQDRFEYTTHGIVNKRRGVKVLFCLNSLIW